MGALVPNLDFNLTHLENLICELRTIKSNCDDAQKFSDEVPAAVGPARLASKVQDFAGQWDDKRREMGEMGEKVGSMAQALDGTHDSLISTDRELRDAVTVEQGGTTQTRDHL